MTSASSRVINLVSDPDWQSLAAEIGANSGYGPAVKIIEKLRIAGVKSAVLEEQYLDRDFSAEYSRFYSTLFRKFRRHCRRIHFFKDELDGLAPIALNEKIKQVAGVGSYLGFIVVRPLKDAPIGRTMLNLLTPPGDGSEAMIEVRAEHPVNLFGASLDVKCLPFMQQDTRVSACAQASIWMSARHFHHRHGGPWQSVADITDAASTPTDQTLAQSLPAGAGGLGANNMLRALRALERYPLLYLGSGQVGAITWPTPLSPAGIVARYAGSGIPVILGMAPWAPGQSEWHAIVVCGSTFDASNPIQRGSRPHNSDYMPYLLVNDDQRGIALRMPVERGLPLGETPYNLTDHCGFVMIPLPNKVFLKAEVAEAVAWDHLNNYRTEWGNLKGIFSSQLGSSLSVGDQAASELDAGRIVARTFLTFGWKHKQQIYGSSAIDVVRERTIVAELPRMVWITEFAFRSSVDGRPRGERKIFAHCVVDATATSRGIDPKLLFHAPGFVWQWEQDHSDFFGTSSDAMYVVKDDDEYMPRARTGPFAG